MFSTVEGIVRGLTSTEQARNAAQTTHVDMAQLLDAGKQVGSVRGLSRSRLVDQQGADATCAAPIGFVNVLHPRVKIASKQGLSPQLVELLKSL